MTQPYCAVCNQDQTQVPTMVLARWQDEDICLDCLENRPGKDEAEAEVAPDATHHTWSREVATGCLAEGPPWYLVAWVSLGAHPIPCPHVVWDREGARLPQGLLAWSSFLTADARPTLLCYACVRAAVQQHVPAWDATPPPPAAQETR